MHLSSGVIAERYKIRSSIQGGMSLIYLCDDQGQNDNPVVLKTLKPQYLSDKKTVTQFLREAVIWIEIGWHPNIVQALGVEYDSKHQKIYLLIELIPSDLHARKPTLRSLLKSGTGMGVEKSLKVMLEVARGMKYATQQIPGLIHCDIKPENIFMGAGGTARIGDFGLVSIPMDIFSNRNTTGLDEKASMSRPMGTPYYMSPEQWRNRKIAISSDIYSLGCVGFELLTGERPIRGRHFRTIAEQHLRGGAKKRALEINIPLELKAFLSRCLEVEAIHRFQGWEEVEQKLIQCYEGLLLQKVEAEVTPIDVSLWTQMQKGKAIFSIGEAYLDKCEYLAAIRCFEKARGIGYTQRNLHLVTRSETSIGAAYSLMNQPERAFAHYKKAMEHAEVFVT